MQFWGKISALAALKIRYNFQIFQNFQKLFFSQEKAM
jgi:hypothetical protein